MSLGGMTVLLEEKELVEDYIGLSYIFVEFN